MACFSLMPSDVGTCPVCGQPIKLASMSDYRKKLLHALDHPLDGVRMRAIIAVGLRREMNAALPLTECALRHPLNIEEGLAVVEALKHLSNLRESAQALAILEHDHAAHAVREAASVAMKSIDIPAI